MQVVEKSGEGLSRVYGVTVSAKDLSQKLEARIADEAAGRHYLSVAQGLLDVSGRWVVSHRWEDWRNEVAWMSLYFSVAVWLSIGLIHAPVLEARAARNVPFRAGG